MNTPERPLLLADLIGSPVLAADGATVGHVVDLEIEPERGYAVTALELGGAAWLDRLNMLRLVKHRTRPDRRRRIPIGAVDRFEHLTIHLKPGYDPDDKRRDGEEHDAGRRA